MIISDIWSIFPGPDVDHISGTECTGWPTWLLTGVGLTCIPLFQNLVLLPSLFCQTSPSPDRSGQVAEHSKSESAPYHARDQMGHPVLEFGLTLPIVIRKSSKNE